MTTIDLTAADIERLTSETFVECIEFHAEIESTNDRAMHPELHAGMTGPVLVLAARQTAGRGRGKNVWWARDGALTFSLVLDSGEQQLPVERWPMVSLTTGLAVCHAVEGLLPEAEVGLKWPNDVFLESRKVCGVLVEVPPSHPGRLVIGIGLNVNNSFADAPSELTHIGTSLVDEGGRSFPVFDVLVEVLRRLEREWTALKDGGAPPVDRWRERCLLTGSTVELNVAGRSTVGVCQGIDQDGALVLWTGAEAQRFFGGVVSRFE